MAVQTYFCIVCGGFCVTTGGSHRDDRHHRVRKSNTFIISPFQGKVCLQQSALKFLEGMTVILGPFHQHWLL